MTRMPISPAGIRSLEDIEALEATPLTAHDLPATTYDALKAGAAKDLTAPALSYFFNAKSMRAPFTLSHAELFAKVTQTANVFRQLGLGRNDVVAYVLPNLPETHYTIWGGSAAGRVLAVNPLLEAEQIGELLDAAQVKLLVTLEKTPRADIWEKTVAAAHRAPSIERILTCSVFDTMVGGGPAPAAMKLMGRWRSVQSPTLRLGDRTVPVSRLMDAVDRAPAEGLSFDPPGPNDISTMLCTGGTTGLPKIALRSHRSEVFDCWAVSQFNPDVGKPGAAVLCGLPLFHSNAILVTGLLPFMAGGHVVLATPQGYRGEGVIADFWKIVEHYRVATFSGVPTVYASLLETAREGADIGSVQFAACGAAPMPVELFNAFVKQTGIPIVEGYGLTEGAVASSLNPTQTDAPRIGSIGLRLPYQDMRCAILDERDAFVRWAGVDEIGVILISGPNVFCGYLIDAQTEGVFIEQDGKRWLNTGDLARQDNDGYFWMTGRKKELIIRGGHNIDPKIIEDAMHKHPAVAMAAAVGRPDKRVGEIPVLYYQVSPGADVSPEELAQFAQVHVTERAAIPKDFVPLNQLPVTAVGKIHKVALAMMEIERAIRAEAAALGVEPDAVDVVQDQSRGVMAKIRVRGECKDLAQTLGRSAFAVDFEDNALA
ncbi:MAG: acyl-CoA synthetase [Caulobacterales bacterium]|nr:acyl-CoA synthetase [Caulobacterales bacterium]